MLFRKLNVAQDPLVTPNITAPKRKSGTKKRKRTNNGNNKGNNNGNNNNR